MIRSWEVVSESVNSCLFTKGNKGHGICYSGLDKGCNLKKMTDWLKKLRSSEVPRVVLVLEKSFLRLSNGSK